MKIRPLGDKVIVRRDEEIQVSVGGIIIPDIAKDKPLVGTVVAAGPGRITKKGTLLPTNLKEGDRVLFGKYDGIEIEIEGEKLLILRADDVVGVVKE